MRWTIVNWTSNERSVSASLRLGKSMKQSLPAHLSDFRDRYQVVGDASLLLEQVKTSFNQVVPGREHNSSNA